MRARLLELTAVVSRLHEVCPWTREQSAADMLAFTRKELVEVEEAMAACADDGGEPGALPRAQLESELGDVLFDVLMLIEASSRAHGTGGLDAVSASAVRKLRRRAPYAFEGGPVVASTEAAAELWEVRGSAPAAQARSYAPAHQAPTPTGTPTPQAGKAAERAEVAERAAPPATALGGEADAAAAGAADALAGLALVAGELRAEAELEGLAEWRAELQRDLEDDGSSAGGEGWQSQSDETDTE